MTKNEFEKFHEKETVTLKTSNPMHLYELRVCLDKLGFEEIDDFFSMKRTDKVYPWQSISIAKVYVFSKTKRLDLIDDESWDTLLISYLFANLPFEFASNFVDVVFKIAEELNLQVEHNNTVCTKENMIMAFYECREDVRNTLSGEPGSDMVGINIDMTYPRAK